jgi:FKBP-type peptidyl-prolyl cis-trans isomerase
LDRSEIYAKCQKSFTTPGGVKITDATPGTGIAAKKGKTLSMRYILKLANGKIIDKNTNGKPVRLPPNGTQVMLHDNKYSSSNSLLAQEK